MKMYEKLKCTKYLLQLPVILVLAGFYPVAEAQVNNVTVSLQVNASQNGMDVTTRGSCGSNNHHGCVEVPVHKKARIQFILNGNRQCNGGSWNLSGVYLGGKNSPQKTGSWGNLDSQVQQDFSVANASTGLLNPDSGSSSQKIVIFDANNHAYDIWYKVTAVCSSGSGSPIETDPRIKNHGTQ
jgi:hypothetical protein